MNLKSVVVLVILLFASPLYAQAANCVCTGGGCKIASDPYPPGADQPTTCKVYVGGTFYISNVVLSQNMPVNNGNVCQPASPNYNPGVAGSVSCYVSIPAQPTGTVTLTMTASNAAGESGQSAPFSFVNVAALATLPKVPVVNRVSP